MLVGHHVRILCAEHNGKFRRQQSPVSPAARSRDKLHDMGQLRSFKAQKGLSARRSKFPGDHLWATNRNNGALNRAFSGLINFKIARAEFKSAEFK
jgi:hypothetical protein